jgi:predicted SAM-dependent methyltransferase
MPAPSSPVSSRRLHIGSGKCYLPGFLNVDLFSNVKADAYHDMTALPYAMGSFDLIYSSHVLEHQHRHMVLATLNHWHGLLERGGALRLAVPNFEAICAHYQTHHNLPELMGLLYGGQDSHLNRHTTTFDEFYLTDLLKKAGFVDIKWWDWRLTDHAEHDDFSQAYLPKMQKDGGRLMSLNMQGTKA